MLRSQVEEAEPRPQHRKSAKPILILCRRSFGCRAYGLGLRVYGLGFRAESLGGGVKGLCLGSGFQGLGLARMLQAKKGLGLRFSALVS